MALLLSNHWLYVHVPKTAGTSISNVLETHNCEHLATHGKLNSQRNLLGKYVFGFVRNPFTRFASLYYSHIRENGKIPIEEFIDTHEKWDYFFDTQTDWLEYNGKLDRIDYIFTKNIKITNYKHLDRKLSSGQWPSDHLPILITY